ncbi:hypothetical protein GQ53DRAFT_29026 [Thozetella sp. PMI_491]|nr:hypothetical protein GQ53DRAFT_29026 [Thozetella sp. PMI_491]
MPCSLQAFSLRSALLASLALPRRGSPHFGATGQAVQDGAAAGPSHTNPCFPEARPIRRRISALARRRCHHAEFLSLSTRFRTTLQVEDELVTGWGADREHDVGRGSDPTKAKSASTGLFLFFHLSSFWAGFFCFLSRLAGPQVWPRLAMRPVGVVTFTLIRRHFDGDGACLQLWLVIGPSLLRRRPGLFEAE